MPARRRNRPNRGRKAKGKMSTRAMVRRDERAPPGNVRDVYRLVRTWFNATVTMPPGTAVLGAINLNSNLPAGLTNFFTGFDLFKIDHVKVRFIPRWNVSGTNAASTDDELPLIATVVNYDDSTAPVSFDAVMAQGGTRMTRFTREVRVTSFPYLLAVPFAASGTPPPGILTPRDTWLNTTLFTTATTVSFPCCKFGISAVASPPGSGKVDIWMEAHFLLAQHFS